MSEQSNLRLVPQESNETPLFTASEFGHKLVVEFLLDKGAKVDAQRTTTSTPLYVACAHGYSKIAFLTNFIATLKL